MSYIGKILVVMQLVLSICLMAFAGIVSSTQMNWKKKSEDLQTQLSKTQSDLQNQTQQNKTATDKFDADMKVEKQLSADLTSKVSVLTAQLTSVSQDNKRMADAAAHTSQINADLADDSNSRQAEVKQVREKLKLAHADRDAQHDRNASLEDKIFEQDTKIERLTVQNAKLMKDNQSYRDVLNFKGLPTEIEDYQKVQAPPPKIEGKVLAARKSKAGSQMLLTISLGENDGLVVNNVVYVYRGSSQKYLGKARVLSVRADEAVCELLPRSAFVEKGDDVATQLN